jgi:hypothetical protein
MKTWIEVGQMLVLGPGTVAAKNAPMVPDMQGADFGAYPSDVEGLLKAWAETTRKNPDSARYVHVSKRISIDHTVNCDDGDPFPPKVRSFA